MTLFLYIPKSSIYEASVIDSDSIIINDISTKPLLLARERSDADTTWLKEQICLLPGYDTWQKLHHHVLSGPDVKGYWEFAVRVVEQYADTRCPSVCHC